MANFSITANNAEVSAALADLLKRIANPQPAMEDIARALANHTEDAFQSQTSPFGPAWADIKEATKERRAAKGHWPGYILQVTGGLAASIIHGADASSAWVGASKKYAAIHQFGGLPSMAPGPRAIPARPYLPFDAAGNLPPDISAELLGIVTGYLQQSGILTS